LKATPELKAAFANRGERLAMVEGLDGRPLPEYVKLVSKSGCNFRAVLNAIETGEML
jgi:hypothetical protein